MTDATASTPRPRLDARRVIDAAVTLADEIGVDDLTIRRLAAALDVKPMTIYHHVANKDAILDGMVDAVFAEIGLPDPSLGWRAALRDRTARARAVLARHPWAVPLMESRTSPGPATLAHHDAVLGCLLGAGMSMSLTAHAYALIDAYLYGFAVQEATLPATGGDEMADLATTIIEPLPADVFPHLAAFTAEHVLRPGYDFRAEFDYGLELILDGLEAAFAAESPASPDL